MGVVDIWELGNCEPRSCGVGELGSWRVGEVGSWECGELGSCGDMEALGW